MPPRLLVEVMPAFASEPTTLLSSTAPALAEQVPRLALHARCSCGQGNCATFYTAPPPTGPWPAPHENIDLDAANGMIILDVVSGTIVCVEVLDRDDVTAALDAALQRAR